MRAIRRIVIHCSASQDGDGRTTMDSIDAWHRQLGYGKIGYHYVIHVDGALYAGRELAEPGVHVKGHNADSIGICLIGTERFTGAQWETLRDLVRNLTTQFPMAQVLGHRDFSPDLDGDGVLEPHEWFKLCPGFDVGAWVAGGMDPLWNAQHVYSTVMS